MILYSEKIQCWLLFALCYVIQDTSKQELLSKSAVCFFFCKKKRKKRTKLSQHVLTFTWTFAYALHTCQGTVVGKEVLSNLRTPGVDLLTSASVCLSAPSAAWHPECRRPCHGRHQRDTGWTVSLTEPFLKTNKTKWLHITLPLVPHPANGSVSWSSSLIGGATSPVFASPSPVSLWRHETIRNTPLRSHPDSLHHNPNQFV